MKATWLGMGLLVAVAGLAASGCAVKGYDYTNYRAYPPRSILVLPPVNEAPTSGPRTGTCPR
jgi:hypothetical protein